MTTPVKIVLSLILVLGAGSGTAKHVASGCLKTPPRPHSGAECPPGGDIVEIIGCEDVELCIEGWPVYRTLQGDLRPLKDVRVFRVDPYHSDSTGDREPVRARVARSGRLRFSARLPRSVRASCDGGKRDASEIWLPRSYALAAPGCEDLLLEVTEQWVPRTIEVCCPGRRINVGLATIGSRTERFAGSARAWPFIPPRGVALPDRTVHSMDPTGGR